MRTSAGRAPLGMAAFLLLAACGETTPAVKSPESAAVGSAEPPLSSEAKAHAATPLAGYSDLKGEREGLTLDGPMTSADWASLIESDNIARACADALSRAQIRQDIAEALNPDAHFDNCRISQSIEYLRAALQRAEVAAANEKPLLALAELGRAIHSVLDFYAHTDFVERSAISTARIEDVVRPALWTTAVPASAWANIVSGTVLYEPGNLCPDTAPSHSQLNKDSGSSARGAALVPAWNMTHYRATATLAKGAALNLLRSTLQRPTWKSVRDRCGSLYGYGLTFDKRKD